MYLRDANTENRWAHRRASPPMDGFWLRKTTRKSSSGIWPKAMPPIESKEETSLFVPQTIQSRWFQRQGGFRYGPWTRSRKSPDRATRRRRRWVGSRLFFLSKGIDLRPSAPRKTFMSGRSRGGRNFQISRLRPVGFYLGQTARRCCQVEGKVKPRCGESRPENVLALLDPLQPTYGRRPFLLMDDCWPPAAAIPCTCGMLRPVA